MVQGVYSYKLQHIKCSTHYTVNNYKIVLTICYYIIILGGIIIKLSVPFNGDVSLINNLKNEEIGMFYGQISEETFGGGRSDTSEFDQENLKKFVKEINQYSIGFNYILNGNCFSDLEFTADVKSKLYSKLQWIEEIGVRMVTFSNPFFIKFCKKYFPNLKISLSVIARVNDLKQLLLWEQEGVDHITLSKDVNRDFETLCKMKKYSNIELQLLVNDPCLPSCHLNNYHNQITSYSSQSILSDEKIDHVSFCTSECRKIMLKDPTNIIRAMWIRPEDIKVYEEIGIRSFKLVDRKESVRWIERATKAYINRKYPGNLADLMSFFSLNKSNGDLEPERSSAKINIENIDWISIPREHKIDFRFKPFIDNSKLDGFINRFVKKGCRNQVCSACGYCSKFSEAVRIVDNDQEVVLHNQDQYIDKLLEIKEVSLKEPDMSEMKDKFELKVSSSENLDFILDNSLDLVITSPPYNIGTDYASSSDDKSLCGYEEFIKNVFNECYKKLKKGAYCIVNIPENIKTDNEVWYYPKIYNSILENIGYAFISLHPWFKLSLEDELFVSKKWVEGKVCKDSHVHSVSEWFMVFKKSDQKEKFKMGEGYTFTPYKTPLHPAAWPVELIEELIINYCRIEGKVLDPFAGICTTGLACVRNDRRFIGVDIAKEYVNIGSRILKEEMSKLKK